MKDVWGKVQKEQVAQAEADLEAAEKQVKDTPMDKAATDARNDLKTKVEELKKDTKFERLKKEWLENDAYAADAYRLLRAPPGGKRLCLTCHTLGDVGIKNAPPLDQLSERLRPNWTLHWLGNPDPMFGYKPTMPAPLEKGDRDSQELFHGDALEELEAMRDAMLSYPRLANLPVNRHYRPVMTGTTPPK